MFSISNPTILPTLATASSLSPDRRSAFIPFSFNLAKIVICITHLSIRTPIFFLFLLFWAYSTESMTFSLFYFRGLGKLHIRCYCICNKNSQHLHSCDLPRSLVYLQTKLTITQHKYYLFDFSVILELVKTTDIRRGGIANTKCKLFSITRK